MDGEKHIINIPDVLQNEDYSCGVFVVQAVASYWGEDWIETELNKELNPDKEFGTTAKDIIKFFKARGLNVWAGSLTIKKLIEWIDKDVPVIMLLQAWDQEDGFPDYLNEEWGHWVVGIGHDDKKIIFEDPACFGRTELSFKELDARWHGEDQENEPVLNHYGIVVWGKKHFDFSKPIHMENLKSIYKEIIKESIQNYSKFPLSALMKQAKKFDDFEKFSHFYSIDIFHGYYWHITDNENFKISSQTGPRDMSSMGGGAVLEKGAIMITSDIDNWASHYGKMRDYAVLFDASDIDPKYLRQVSRGFGNEVYLDSNQAKNLKQVGIYNLNYAKSLDKKFSNMIPQSKERLLQLYNFAHKNG